MKKFLLSILIVLMTALPVSAEYFKDIIVTSPDGIWTDSRAYSTLNDAITAVGADERTIVVPSEQTVTSLTVPSNVTLRFERDGSITNSGQLTINTTQIEASSRQIFTGAGDIDFANGTIVKTSWFSDFVEAVDMTNDDYITLLVTELSSVDANCTLGNNVILKSEAYGNRIVADAGFTLSNIKNIECPAFQLFAGSGDFDFLDGTVLKSSWFNNLRAAVNFANDENTNITIIIDEDSSISVNLTIDGYFTLDFNRGCYITVDGGVTSTITNPVYCRPDETPFIGAGTANYTSINSIDEISDDDGDTLVQVEEAADEDIIRGDVGGDEKLRIDTDATASYIQVNSHADEDNDTKIQVEESADEDIVRIDVGGDEKFYLGSDATASYLQANALMDEDGDTMIQVEESADEDKIRFDTGGTERVIIDENGDVGIGTSIPSVPGLGDDVVLQVEGNFPAISLSESDVSQIWAFIAFDGTFRLFDAKDDKTVITIDSSQNVGIGTIAPGNPLAVNRSGDGVIVDFESADTVEGNVSIAGNVTSYNAFVGSHYTQLKEAQEELPVGAVVVSTGEIIPCTEKETEQIIESTKDEAEEDGKLRDGYLKDNGNYFKKENILSSYPQKEYFVYINTTNKPGDKSVYGVWLGKLSDNAKGQSFGQDDKAIYLIAQVGLFKIRVTDTNGNIENGDFLESSSRPMEAQKQSSGSKLNSTIAKAIISVDWSKEPIDPILGYKWKLIPCTF